MAGLPACSHRPPCPGCPGYGRTLISTAAFGHLQRLADAAGVELTRMEGPALGYRHRSRLAIRGRTRSPKIGIFAAGTHDIVDIPRCGVHHATINHVAQALRQLVRVHGLSPYREAGHLGRLRYLQVAVERASGAAQVVVVDRAERSAGVLSAIQDLPGLLGSRLHSLFWNSQSSVGNAVLGQRLEHVYGPAAMIERLGGAEVHFPPDAFAQANMPLFSRAVELIHSWVPDGLRVVEYYAGVGAIGLGLVARSHSVVCNEIAPGSLRGLALGRAQLPASLQARLTVLPGPAGDCTAALDEADVVLVDPPRKGLDHEVLAALCGQPVPQLIYLSCGLPAFLRETQALQSAGYRLQALCAIDLFPNTEHVETLAHFVHGSPGMG